MLGPAAAFAEIVDIERFDELLEDGELFFVHLGGFFSFHFAFGDHDAYVIVDVPDNESAAAIALTVNAAGGATAKTVVLLTPEEVDAAAKRSVDYRRPGA